MQTSRELIKKPIRGKTETRYNVFVETKNDVFDIIRFYDKIIKNS